MLQCNGQNCNDAKLQVADLFCFIQTGGRVERGKHANQGCIDFVFLERERERVCFYGRPSNFVGADSGA